MKYLLLIIVGIVFYLFKIKKARNPDRKLPTRKDYGTFVRYTTAVKVANDISLYVTADIPKDKQDFIIDVNSRITDRELTDYGYKGSSYQYNVKSRKWVDSLHPFNERTPSLFITFMISAWEEVNRPLPEKKKRVPTTHVSITCELVDIPQYDNDNLLKLGDKINVEGSSGETYQVSLSKMECTCQDFIKRRVEYRKTDCRRACKHIAKQIVKQHLNTKLIKNSMVQSFIRHASSKHKGVPPFDKMLLVVIDENIRGPGQFYMLIGKQIDPWVDILFFSTTNYQNYGYNIEEKRWSYGSSPFPNGCKTKYNLAIQQAYKQYL